MAAKEATKRLDDGFFKLRFDRLTSKEGKYVVAMAKLGEGPYRSSDVAAALNETPQSLGPRRAQIISKGMIYSPSHGDIAFTVPLFSEYLMRNYVEQASNESVRGLGLISIRDTDNAQDQKRAGISRVDKQISLPSTASGC
jgi:hypothetical protein